MRLNRLSWVQIWGSWWANAIIWVSEVVWTIETASNLFRVYSAIDQKLCHCCHHLPRNEHRNLWRGPWDLVLEDSQFHEFNECTWTCLQSVNEDSQFQSGIQNLAFRGSMTKYVHWLSEGKVLYPRLPILTEAPHIHRRWGVELGGDLRVLWRGFDSKIRVKIG